MPRSTTPIPPATTRIPPATTRMRRASRASMRTARMRWAPIPPCRAAERLALHAPPRPNAARAHAPAACATWLRASPITRPAPARRPVVAERAPRARARRSTRPVEHSATHAPWRATVVRRDATPASAPPRRTAVRTATRALSEPTVAAASALSRLARDSGSVLNRQPVRRTAASSMEPYAAA